MKGTVTWLECQSALHIIITTLTLYLESLWWKGSDVISAKIEEHQSVRTREGLGVDGFNGISLQVDTLNVWKRFQSTSLQLCDVVLTLAQQKEHHTDYYLIKGNDANCLEPLNNPIIW